MIAATEARRAHETRLVDLTSLRVHLEHEIALRQQLLDNIRAEIDVEVSFLARAARVARGVRCSLGELVDALAPHQTPQEGHR